VFVARVKLRGAEEYNLDALREAIDDILYMPYSAPAITAPGDVRIIRKAYTEDVLNQILFFQEQIAAVQDDHIRDFLQLALLAVLESVSHTSKDGQYLRLRPTARLSDVREALSSQLDMMWGDLTGVGQQALRLRPSTGLSSTKSQDIAQGKPSLAGDSQRQLQTHTATLSRQMPVTLPTSLTIMLM
jgi:hypothetical protein